MSTPFVLYRMYDAADRLLYVGQTINPSVRFGHHRLSRGWWTDVVTVRLEHFKDHESLVEAEQTAISTERPVHNLRHNGYTGGQLEWSTQQRAEAVRTAETDALMSDAKTAREGRDLWRTVPALLAKLVDKGVSYTQIEEQAGIRRATAHRMVVQFGLRLRSSSTTGR